MSGEEGWGWKVQGEESRWPVWGEGGNEDRRAEVGLGMEGKSGEGRTRPRHVCAGPE